MARPKGKQITVTCVVCGTKRDWPPSKAAGKKFCSRECQFSGQRIAGDWGQALWFIDHRDILMSDLPPTPDPLDRIRVIGGRWFRRQGGDWFELTADYKTWRSEITSTPIDEADIPSAEPIEVTR